jgi:hypothetical protein
MVPFPADAALHQLIFLSAFLTAVLSSVVLTKEEAVAAKVVNGSVPSNAALVVDRADRAQYFLGMTRNKMLTCLGLTPLRPINKTS